MRFAWAHVSRLLSLRRLTPHLSEPRPRCKTANDFHLAISLVSSLSTLVALMQCCYCHHAIFRIQGSQIPNPAIPTSCEIYVTRTATLIYIYIFLFLWTGPDLTQLYSTHAFSRACAPLPRALLLHYSNNDIVSLFMALDTQMHITKANSKHSQHRAIYHQSRLDTAMSHPRVENL